MVTSTVFSTISSTSTIMPSSKIDNSEQFSEILANLKLDGDSTALPAYSTDTYKYAKSNEAFNNDSQSSDYRGSIVSNGFSNLQYKSKFKTIKIFVASNKNEFGPEGECLLQEAQPELQQYFLQFGYDVFFIDMNLNYDYDPFVDPYAFQCMLQEIEECSKCSDAIFFLGLLGNKYGTVPLPIVIGKAEFESIVSAAKHLSLDADLLTEWYVYDEFSTIPRYRLRPIINSHFNFYNKISERNESCKQEQKAFRQIQQNLIDIIQASIQHAKIEFSKFNEILLTSGMEQLTNYALRMFSNECLLISRVIEGIDSSKKNAGKYLDMSNGKLDKKRDECQVKFRDSVLGYLTDENKHQFCIAWKDNSEDIAEFITVDSHEHLPVSLNKYDSDYRHYLESFNAVVVSKVKHLIDKRLQEELQVSTRQNETLIYQEATRHLNKYQSLSELNLYQSEEVTERVKKLITLGMKNPHYPLFIYGSAVTGKTVTLANFASTAYQVIEPKNCMTVVRFSDLTSQCSTFEGLLYSICEQLAIFQKLSPLNEIRNRDLTKLIDYFHKSCAQISSASKKQLLIIIDGILDINLEKSYLAKSNVCNNQISWLFMQPLPPRVHMVVSIKRQSLAIPVKDASTTNGLTSSSQNMVPLFLHHVNDKMSSEAENYLFEVPFTIRKTDVNLLSDYISYQLSLYHRKLNEQQLKLLTQHLVQNKQVDPTASSTNTLTANSPGLNLEPGQITPIATPTSPDSNSPSIPLLTTNYDSQTVFFYLNLLFSEIVMANKYNNDLSDLLKGDNFPKDVETLVNYRLANIEKRFNKKMVTSIFNYITAAHNGITEMELLDLLSCNNEFFSDFYSDVDLPPILRFPTSLWIFVKSHLGNLISYKYMDNKITYFWSYDCIKKMMKQKYFNKVDQIRICHRDMANYYLESFVETKPLVDMNKNMQIRDEEAKRYICQQPLLYSETRYNYRRLSELWYHLMNSGDIQRLKENALFNFEHLLAKCHGMGVQALLNDIDGVLRRILDSDILLISYLLRKSVVTLSQDPLRLASEILARLRPLQDEYGEHVKNLVKQATDWCEKHESPVLIPLSTWLESPENLLITRIDHPEGINKLAVTSFNQHVFFSTNKHEICMYHIPSKKLVRKFTGHNAKINFLHISNNNRYLISGAADKLIKVWNLGTGDIEHTFNNHKADILCAVLTHNDEFIITGTYDRLVNVIRLETGDMVHSLEKHFDAITAIAISQDDTILVTASLDKSIKRWSFEDMEVIDKISTIYSPITSMVITTDNTFVIIGCENKTVHVKSLITGTDLHELSGHNSVVTSLAAASDNERIYVACSDSKLYLYDVRTKELIAVLIEQESSINDLKISSDNSFLFSSSGNSLFVLNLKKKKFNSKKALNELTDPLNFIKAFSISKEGDMAITGNESGQVNLWNLIDGELLETIIDPAEDPGKVGGICQTALSNSHVFSVVATKNNLVCVYDNEMGDIVTEFTEHQSQVKHLYILDEKILTSDGFNSCKIWLAHSGQLLESITVDCNMLGLSPDATYVVSGPGENMLKIWSLSDAKVIRKIDHPMKITVICFTADSHYVITGGEDNSCKIWELCTGKLIQVLIEHDGPITTIAVPTNNNIVLSGSKDKHAIIWNFKDGTVVHKLPAHQDEIVKVAVTYDSIVAISASKDSVVNVWSARFGFLLTSINLQYILSDLLVSSDGKRMIARFEDNAAMPIIGLTSKWTREYVRTMSQASLRSIENILKSEGFSSILPIKPKPLLFPKKTSQLASLFSSNYTTNQVAYEAKRDSEVTSAQPTETVSTGPSQSNSRGDLHIKKPKRKTKKVSVNSSQASIVNNNEEKPKKTKICCLL